MKKQRILGLLLAATLVFTNTDMTLYVRAEENTALTTVASPEAEESIAPVGTASPETEPTIEPTIKPTIEPTIEPTAESTAEPTVEPGGSSETEITPTPEIPSEATPEITPEATPETTPEPTLTPEATPTLEAVPTATLMKSAGRQLIEMQADTDGIYQAGSFEVDDSGNGGIGGIQLFSLEENKEEAAKEVLHQGMLAKEARIDISDYEIDNDRVEYLVKAIINDNPELYYVTSFRWSYYTNNNKVAYVVPEYAEGLDDAAFKSALADALAVVDDSMTDLEKAIALHEYLVLNCEYDSDNYSNNTIPGTSYSAYGALVNRIAVCQGYALAYMYLCKQVGIDCYMVTSAAMCHAWNMIVLNGKYYQVDVTWDDPTTDRIGQVMHKHMFISDEQMQVRNHSGWEVTMGSDVVPLVAEDTTYDNYFWTNAVSQLIDEEDDYYYVDNSSTGRIMKYSMTDQSLTKIVDLGKWYVWNNASSYWSGAYSGLFRLGDRLYYNTMRQIESIALDGTQQKVEYEPDISAGYLYGLAYVQGRAKYLICESPNAIKNGEIYEVDINDFNGEDYSVPVSSVILDRDEITLKKGSNAILTASIVPSYASGYTIAWTSSDNAVATVKDGVVTGIGQGSCVITATAGGKSARCTVNVTEKLEAPKLVPETGTYVRGASAVTIDRNATVTLTAKEGADIYYSTDKGESTLLYKTPIMIDQSMTIYAMAVMEGYEDSELASETYIACDNELTLSKSDVELTEGESSSLSVLKLPTGRTREDIKWTSSNEAIATCVDGKITAVKGNDGTANITATVSDHKGSTVTATCKVTVKPIEYSVSFKDWDGTLIDTQNVFARRNAVLPEDPQRAGYNFTGWSGNYQNIDKNEVLIATYQAKEYRITYDLNGGTAEEENPSAYTIETDDITLQDAVGQDGTVFMGWYEEGKSAPVTKIEKGSTGDIALIAKWKLVTPEFSIPAGKVAEGVSLTLSAQKEDATIYYTIDGSAPVVGNENCYQYEKAITLDETIATNKVVQIKAITVLDGYESSDAATAEYTVIVPQKFKVTFRDWDGATIKEIDVLEGQDAHLPEENPERTGYDFTGWKGNYREIAKNEVLTAEYTPHAYSITYMLDGGNNDKENPENYTIESPEITLREAGNKPGYFFDGWYKDAEYRDAATVIPSGSHEDIILYAKWTGVETEEGLWIAGIENQIYTGKAIKPVIRVYNGTVLLEEQKDYTVTYKNNIKVNDDFASKTVPTVIISGKGNYSGKAQATFLILPKEISGQEEQIFADPITLKASAWGQKPDVKLTVENKILKKNRDYKLSYWKDEQEIDSVKEAGIYRIKITGIGNYAGSRFVELTVTDAKLISKASVSRISSWYYTGSEIMPELTVKDGLTVLEKGTDYSVRYENNCNPGTATVVITGMGDYAGEKKVTFTIVGIPMSRVSVTGLQSTYDYTGSEITQSGYELATNWNGAKYTLVEGADYEVSYYNNKKAGTASVIFTGKGGFSGTLRKTFKINKIEIEEDIEQLEIDDMTASSLIGNENQYTADYTKGGAKPEPTIKINGEMLTAGVDYTVKYRNNNSADGIGTMIIYGKGGFRGTIKIPFLIKQKDLSTVNNSGVTMTAPDKVYREVKNNYIIAPTLKDSSGKTLKAGTDYDKDLKYTYAQRTVLGNGLIREAGEVVHTDDILPIGTEVKVSVTGKGNYKGTIESSYRIVEKDIKFATVRIQSQTYKGKAVTLDPSDITIRMGGTILGASDYEIVSYKNNYKTGIATVTIKGRGNTYGGTKSIRFYIKPSRVIWWWKNR